MRGRWECLSHHPLILVGMANRVQGSEAVVRVRSGQRTRFGAGSIYWRGSRNWAVAPFPKSTGRWVDLVVSSADGCVRSLSGFRLTVCAGGLAWCRVSVVSMSTLCLGEGV